MKAFVCALFLLAANSIHAEESAPKFDAAAAERFANLALACVDKAQP